MNNRTIPPGFDYYYYYYSLLLLIIVMMIITIVMEHTRHSHSLLYYNNTIRWRMVRLLCYSNPLSSTWIELLSGDELVDRIAFR